MRCIGEMREFYPKKKYVEIIIMRLIYAVRINNVILAKEKENNTQFYILSHTK